MKKRFLALLLCVILLTLCTGLPVWGADSAQMEEALWKIHLDDGNRTEILLGYTPEGGDAPFFPLRGIAYMLRGSGACFDVQWREADGITELKRGTDYSGERPQRLWSVSGTISGRAREVVLLTDGQKITLNAYEMAGNNYFRLEDLAPLLRYRTSLRGDGENIHVYTEFLDTAALDQKNAGSTSVMRAEQATARWAAPVTSCIFDADDKRFSVLRRDDKAITVCEYDAKTLQARKTLTVKQELERFGGFYAGETYNYIVFGHNLQEKGYKSHGGDEVFRVVKYDKSFKRLASLAISARDSGTFAPFDAASLRMEEKNDVLVIHTGRTLYDKDANGARHQTQVSMMVDTAQMKLLRFAGSWVSHSFNQFVRWDGNVHVMLDHGDAYPRSVVLSKFDLSDYRTVDLFTIPGEIGANCTGVTVGGFEVSESNYIAAINTVDQSRVKSYDSFNIKGLARDERNIVLLVSGKDNFDSAKVKRISLTDYYGKKKLGSTPYLVKLTDNRFALLWEEYEYCSTEYGERALDRGLRYCYVDGNGKLLGKVLSAEGKRLSADCQPQCIGDRILWFVDTKTERCFYAIDNPYAAERASWLKRSAVSAPVQDTHAAAYPCSGYSGTLIRGAVIGPWTGFGGSTGCGAGMAQDGNPDTYYDPYGVGDGFTGIDAGEKYTLSAVAVLSRKGWEGRLDGAVIQGSNDGLRWTTLYTFSGSGMPDTFQIVTAFQNNTGYSMFRYYNECNHGDVAELEFYGTKS